VRFRTILLLFLAEFSGSIFSEMLTTLLLWYEFPADGYSLFTTEYVLNLVREKFEPGYIQLHEEL
jgi:hypothetical protein